jgi:hypothetical protein
MTVPRRRIHPNPDATAGSWCSGVEDSDATVDTPGPAASTAGVPSRRTVTWHPERRVSAGFLGTQFCVCVGSWVVVVLLIEGKASTSGLVASIVTGVVLVVVSWCAVKVGWDIAPSAPRLEDEGGDPAPDRARGR